MNEPAAFRASYSDLRFVKSRKVAQVIVELPIEDAGRFVEAFGAPNPATETWVAIARLQEPVKAQEKPAKKAWADLPYSQQAAMRCQEIGFQKFINQKMLAAKRYMDPSETHEDRAARYIREWCHVDSRSDITKGKFTGDQWKLLDDAYFAWQRGFE